MNSEFEPEESQVKSKKTKKILEQYTCPLTQSKPDEEVKSEELISAYKIRLKNLENDYKKAKLDFIKEQVETFTNILKVEEEAKKTSRIFLLGLASAILIIQNGFIFYFLTQLLKDFLNLDSSQITGLASIFSIITTATLTETYFIFKKITEYLFRNNFNRQVDLLEKIFFSANREDKDSW